MSAQCFLCTKKLSRNVRNLPVGISKKHTNLLVQLGSFKRRACSQLRTNVQHDGENENCCRELIYLPSLENKLLPALYCSGCTEFIGRIGRVFRKLGRLEDEIVKFKEETYSKLTSSVNNPRPRDDSWNEEEGPQYSGDPADIENVSDNGEALVILNSLRNEILEGLNWQCNDSSLPVVSTNDSSAEQHAINKIETTTDSDGLIELKTVAIKSEPIWHEEIEIPVEPIVKLVRLEDMPEFKSYSSCWQQTEHSTANMDEEEDSYYYEGSAKYNNEKDESDEERFPIDSNEDTSNDNDQFSNNPKQLLEGGTRSKNAVSKKYLCTVEGCEFKSRSRRPLNIHIRRVHTSLVFAKTFTCNICDRQYVRYADLRLHKKNVHFIIETPWKCRSCGESFPSTRKVWEHRRITQCARNEKYSKLNSKKVMVFDAQETDKENPAQDDSSHSQHQRSAVTAESSDGEPLVPLPKTTLNESEKVFCTEDGCFFRTKSESLLLAPKRTVHASEVAAKSPLVCNLCQRQYVRYADLRVHKRNVHSIIETPWKCKSCGDCFPSTRKMWEHRRITQCSLYGKSLKAKVRKDTKSSTGISSDATEAKDKDQLEHDISRLRSDNYRQRESSATPDKEIRASIPLKKRKTKSRSKFPESDILFCAEQGCEFRTKSEAQLAAHARKVHTRSVFGKALACNLCSRQYVRSADLRLHKKNVHSVIETPWQCKSCGESFPSVRAMFDHRRTAHNDGLTNECPKCSKKFNSTTHLKRHLSTHGEAPGYFCDLCGISYKSESTLNFHKHSKHSHLFPELLDKYKCKECNRIYGSPATLRNHIKTQHRREYPFHCPICGVGLLVASRLKWHMFSHSNEKTVECKICHAKFKRPTQLNIHMRRHTGDYKHACSICSKKFSNSGARNRHEEIHSGELKYFCQHCGKGFPVRNYL